MRLAATAVSRISPASSIGAAGPAVSGSAAPSGACPDVLPREFPLVRTVRYALRSGRGAGAEPIGGEPTHRRVQAEVRAEDWMDRSDDGFRGGAADRPGSTDVGAAGDTDLVFAPGDRCGQDYVISGLIARGGMAQIYRARHEIMRREVAIKVLAPRYAGRSDVRGRMEAEARALAEIDHPNIVKIFHAGRDDRVELYIVMELLDGKDLRTIMDWAGALPIPDALAYAIEIADATAALHDLGIFHRDIKPENVFVVRARGGSGRVLKLLDLGAAKIPKYGQRTTGSFSTIGTGAYMSPEHVRGQPITAASDVYSLGLMLYEMIAGRHPFGAGHPTTPTHHDFCRWQLLAKPEPLGEIAPRVSPELEALVARALEKDPAKRPPSMEAFASALRACLRDALSRGGEDEGRDAASGRVPSSLRRQADTIESLPPDAAVPDREKTTRPERIREPQRDTDVTPVAPAAEERAGSMPSAPPRPAAEGKQPSPRAEAASRTPPPASVERTSAPADGGTVELSQSDLVPADEATGAPSLVPSQPRARLWTAPIVGVVAAVVVVAAVLAVRHATSRSPSTTSVEPAPVSSSAPPRVEPTAEPTAEATAAPTAEPAASSIPSAPPPPSASATVSARPVPVPPAVSAVRPRVPGLLPSAPPAADAGPPPFKEIF